MDALNSWANSNSWTYPSHNHKQLVQNPAHGQTQHMNTLNLWTRSTHAHTCSWTHFNSCTHSTLEHIELGHTQLLDTLNSRTHSALMDTPISWPHTTHGHTQLMALNSWIHPTHRHTQPMDTSDSRTHFNSCTHSTHRYTDLVDSPDS
jgi:hypothetical protein